MLRTILIPIEDDINGVTAVEHLWTVATLYQARVYGLRIVDVNTLKQGMHETEEARRLLERDARRHLTTFEQACRDRELVSKTEVVIGEAVEEIALSTPRSDLLIMGEALSSVSGKAFASRKSFVHAVLHRITRPILIAREGHERLQRIVVGYDGSEKGSHALQLGADMAERAAASLTVIVAADTKEYGTRVMDDAAFYLGAYNLTWHPVVFEGAPNEALSRSMRNEKADMVIVGSHGHGRLHELAFGSTTNHVLEHIHSSILIYR